MTFQQKAKMDNPWLMAKGALVHPLMRLSPTVNGFIAYHYSWLDVAELHCFDVAIYFWDGMFCFNIFNYFHFFSRLQEKEAPLPTIQMEVTHGTDLVRYVQPATLRICM